MSASDWAFLARDFLSGAAREAVYAGWALLAVLLVDRLLGRRWPALRQALWSLVLVRLVLPPGLASPVSVRAWIDGAATLGATPATTSPAAGMDATSWVAAPSVVAEAGGAEALVATPWWALALVALWAVGVLAFGLRLGRRLIGYHRLVAKAQPVSDATTLSAVRRWRKALRLRRSVRFVTSEAAVPPFTLGVWRPAVFLPASLLRQASREQIETVVAHELAHVRRFDALWLHLQNVVQTLWFFHPAAWIAGLRLDAARELLCDRLVLDRGALTAREYAKSLLGVVRLQASSGWAAPSTLVPHSSPVSGFAQGRIPMRIRELLDSSSRRAGRRRAVLVAAILGLVLLPMASVPHTATAEVARPAAAPTGVLAASPLTGFGAHSPYLAAVTMPGSPLQGERPLLNPIPGAEMTSGFGERKNPFTGKMAHHRGVDLRADAGTPVLAPADGRVELASTYYENEDWGTVVILDHGGGVKTFYSHLEDFRVTAGQKVERGQVFATAGETGQVTGPHLHFELWIDGEPADPSAHVTDLGC